MLELILLLLMSESSKQVLLRLNDLSLKHIIITLDKRNLWLRYILICYCCCSVRSGPSHTVHVDIPLVTNDYNLLSVIHFFRRLLLLWYLINNHLLDSGFFPFNCLLTWTSLVISLNLWVLLAGNAHSPNMLPLWRLIWVYHLFFIILIWVPHPPLLLLLSLCRYRHASFCLTLSLLLLYLDSLLFGTSFDDTCQVTESTTLIIIVVWFWGWRLISVVVIEDLAPSRDFCGIWLLMLLMSVR